jgi:glycosyltransferase involved in cell wall biosynthesis
MSNPLISVVIPIYNEEQLIENLFEKTINSLSEISKEFEVICVDDGSTDESLSKLIKIKDSKYLYSLEILAIKQHIQQVCDMPREKLLP